MASWGWISFILSLAGLFLSSWVLIPAPNYSLLPLAVGAPEISPLLLLGNGAVLLLTLSLRRLKNRPALACSLVAVGLSSLPLLQLPGTLTQAKAAFEHTFGPIALAQVPADQVRGMRPSPFSAATLFQGIGVPSIKPDRPLLATADGGQLPLEIYRPATPGLHPTIVAIYGGAWQRGSPAQTAQFSRYLVAQGYTVVALNYRHAPQYRFPTQLQDVQAGLAFVRREAKTYGIDLNRIALMGWSSGAHLAMLAAYQPDAMPIRSVVSYYGPIDLIEGYRNPPFPDPIDTRAVLEAFLGGNPEQVPDLYKQASPIQFVRPHLPPTLLIYGARDHLVKAQFGQLLHDRLQARGNTSFLLLLPWAEHAFDAVFRGMGNQVALYYTERFLAATMNH